MYAIIKSGGRQARVAEGDVLEIDRVTSDGDLEFTPIMLVGDDGTVITDPSKLGKAKVKAKVLGETKGEKLHVFKFKNKTGYRRRIGHRQKFSTIEVTGITGAPKAKSSTSADADAKKADTKKADKKVDKETDAAKADTKRAESKKAESKKAESKKTEPNEAESKKTEPKKTESKKAEPAEAETSTTAGAEAEDTKKEQEDS